MGDYADEIEGQAYAAGYCPCNVDDTRCVHEMIKDQCGLCSPRQAPASTDPFEPADDSPVGPWFSCAYGGECSKCGGTYDDGDMIRADGYGDYEGQACCG